ncbi:amidase [Amorphus sp. 3PC139-8]|uniref:amidase n=1 Tax=Amorphus sp. 3PC139-8 TaxID=2735676 RepID=UPI00345CAAEC
MRTTTSAAGIDYHCFCPYPHADVPHAAGGALSGLTFAVKDLFDVAGYPTGCGHPEWPGRDHPADHTAPAIEMLLKAGADCLAKTETDEIAYSLYGQNPHYGTPVNPAAPDRVPGGSSSGSAVATAAGLVDFAIGTDTAGSVRIPASFCGIYGFRPSHGCISADGCMELARSYDTVGWFARSAAMLARIGDVLIEAPPSPKLPHCLLLDSAFDLVEPQSRPAIDAAVRRISFGFERVFSVPDVPPREEDWGLTFRVTQAAEVWAGKSAWIEERHPHFSAGVQSRLDWARGIAEDEIDFHVRRRREIRSVLTAQIGPDSVLCLPTAPAAAPLLSTAEQDLQDFRTRIIMLTCLAGLAGLPQVTLPLAQAPNGAPIGISLIGAVGSDHVLLRLAREISEA